MKGGDDDFPVAPCNGTVFAIHCFDAVEGVRHLVQVATDSIQLAHSLPVQLGSALRGDRIVQANAPKQPGEGQVIFVGDRAQEEILIRVETDSRHSREQRRGMFRALD